MAGDTSGLRRVESGLGGREKGVSGVDDGVENASLPYENGDKWSCRNVRPSMVLRVLRKNRSVRNETERWTKHRENAWYDAACHFVSECEITSSQMMKRMTILVIIIVIWSLDEVIQTMNDDSTCT